MMQILVIMLLALTVTGLVVAGIDYPMIPNVHAYSCHWDDDNGQWLCYDS